MRTIFDPRAGAAATGLFLGGLAISAAVALVTAPLTPRLAVAETVSSANERPTVRVLPNTIATMKRDSVPADPSTGIGATQRGL